MQTAKRRPLSKSGTTTLYTQEPELVQRKTLTV